MTVYDIVLKNATINDGTGRPTYRADIYINGPKIADIKPAGTYVTFYTRCSVNETGNTFNPDYFESRGDNTMYITANPAPMPKPETPKFPPVAGEEHQEPFHTSNTNAPPHPPHPATFVKKMSLNHSTENILFPIKMFTTFLHDFHVAANATMTDFFGWQMPLVFSSMTEEHIATRASAGVFDLGHMGRLAVRGAGAFDFVNRVTPVRLAGAEPGTVLYSFVLDADGAPIDDVTIYYDSPTELMMVVNASNREAVLAHLAPLAIDADIELADMTFELGMIAIQGPAHEAIMSAVLGAEFAPCEYYRFYKTSSGNIISATGYTGEKGYEIYAPGLEIRELWEALLEAGATPVGLGARDTLRLEAAMPLFGHELTTTTTPTAAGLTRFLDMEKPGGFIGREALVNATPTRKLVGFELTAAGRGPIARQRMAVFDETGATEVGTVTSGCLSPTLGKIIGMAYIDVELAVVNTALTIDVRGRKIPATVVQRPFYKRNG